MAPPNEYPTVPEPEPNKFPAESNSQFQKWQIDGPLGSIAAPQVIVNKQCTHCAIVWRQGWGPIQESVLQQLWSVSTGQLQWSSVGALEYNALAMTPAFSPDGVYVGFGDLMYKDRVHLLAVSQGDSTFVQRFSVRDEGKTIGFSFTIEHLAISPAAKRIAVRRPPTFSSDSEGSLLTTIQNSENVMIDYIGVPGSQVAMYYSESGNLLYSLNINHSETVYTIYRFDLLDPSSGARSIQYQPSFDLEPSQFQGYLHSFLHDSGPSGPSILFKGSVYTRRGPRKFGFLAHTRICEDVVVTVPFQERKGPKWRFLSSFEQLIVSDGSVLIIDRLKLSVFELDSGLSPKLIATFSGLPKLWDMTVLGVRDGWVYWVERSSGDLKRYKSRRTELTSRTLLTPQTDGGGNLEQKP